MPTAGRSQQSRQSLPRSRASMHYAFDINMRICFKRFSRRRQSRAQAGRRATADGVRFRRVTAPLFERKHSSCYTDMKPPPHADDFSRAAAKRRRCRPRSAHTGLTPSADVDFSGDGSDAPFQLSPSMTLPSLPRPQLPLFAESAHAASCLLACQACFSLPLVNFCMRDMRAANSCRHSHHDRIPYYAGAAPASPAFFGQQAPRQPL